MFGSEVDSRVELDGKFSRSSIVIPLHVFSDAVTTVEHVLLSRHGQALSTSDHAGMGAIAGAFNLYKLFKKKRGRLISDEDGLSRILATPKNRERLLLIKTFATTLMSREQSAALRLLRTEGIAEFQTRRREVITECVYQSDLTTADEAEEAVILEVEEKALKIERRRSSRIFLGTVQMRERLLTPGFRIRCRGRS